jgi:tripartite-type tricarboxylate transporter receptor subunit TctC
MKMKSRVLLQIAVLALGLTAVTTSARTEPYPIRPVVLVSPFPAGGGVDVLCRHLAEKLRGALGQPVIVENRSGGGGNVGTEAVARAVPDGHVLLCAPDPIFTSHLLYPKLSFDPQAFEPVSVFGAFFMGIVGRPDLLAGDMAQLVAYARSHPGKLTYASAGVGQFGHLLMEALKLKADIDLVHVPYRGGAPAVNDLLAGHVDVYTGTLASTISQVKAGKLKLLAPTGGQRLADFPDVLALPEAVGGLQADSWLAVAAPPGTPREITSKLSAAIAQAVQAPDLKARFADLQSEPLSTTPEKMRDMMRLATEQWRHVIVAANIRIE